jgi:DAK2 domain fusion protein YloV
MSANSRPAAVDLFAAAARALADRVDEVNRLNVFPVPDGDTGTNMTLTLEAVQADLDRLPASASMADIASAITHGSLMGARGNSGVILSQMLRGLCEVAGQATELTPKVVAAALERSTTVAFQAVRKPVEGTMLTVLKDSAAAATAGVKAGLKLDELLDAVVEASFESVRRGPDLLPVLKENGVVDAGGLGVAILGEGFVAALEGHEVREYDVTTAPGPLMVQPVDDWADDEYLYCTEFLLHGVQADISVLEEYVAEIGGSELVVGDAETYKIHVHTDTPGTVLTWATGLGEVSDVHINNMRRQTAERTAGIKRDAEPTKPIGFVAVAAGQGLKDILLSLGADVVVSGGQTMNPSTAELLEAAQSINAEKIVLLPNNRNIILAAQQVTGVADRPVAVVPTTAIPQAFAALLAYDGSDDLDAIIEEMTAAAGEVRTAEVTVAVKDATGKVGPIKAGDVIGIVDHEIEVTGSDVADVTLRVVEHIIGDGETITLLGGEDLDDEAMSALETRLAEAHPDAEVEAHRGDQPLYPIIVSVE